MEQKIQHLKEPGILELLGRLPDQASLLLRSQMALAKAEVSAKVKEVVKDSIMVAVGAFILYVALLAAVATAIIVIGIFIPLWISALIVTLALFIGGGVLALVGINGFKKMKIKPTKTIETLKENIQWLKHQTS